MKKLLSILAICLLGTSALAAQDKVLLTPDNTVVFNQEVNADSVASVEFDLITKSLQRGTSDEPIYLVMNCPGGSIYAGEQFIQFAKTIPNVKTVTIFAASMCSAIVEALPGERLVTEHGVLMFHRAKGQFQGQFEEGEVESELRFFKSMILSMEKRNAKRLSMSIEDYKKNVKDEWWMYGQDNIDSKAADRMADIMCSNELVAKGCPLLPGPYSKPESNESKGASK